MVNFRYTGSGDAPAPGLDNVWDPKLWNPTSAYFDSVPPTKKYKYRCIGSPDYGYSSGFQLIAKHC